MKIIGAIKRSFSVFNAAYKGLWQVRALVWVGVVLIAGITASLVLFQAQKTSFAFAKQQCINGVIVLPAQQAVRTNTQSSVTYQKAIAVAGFPLVARGVCYDFKSAPAENKTISIKHSLFGLGVLTKKVELSVGGYPKLVTNQLPTTISTAKPLQFNLTSPDSFFSYTLQTGQAKSPCLTEGESVTCEVKSLGLEHSKTYEFALAQSFNNVAVGTVASMQAVTASPVVLTSQTIPSGATIYDKPTQLVIAADKSLQSVDGITLTAKNSSGEQKQIAATTKIENQKIIIIWAEPLPRRADLSLTIATAASPDGGVLLSPFTATYKTSGGPRVVGINVRDRAVPLGQRIVLTLDQALQPGQNLQTLFGIKVGATTLPATITVTGRTVTITPNAAFTRCAAFQVWAADGALNTSGISGGSTWTFNSRSTCATVVSIGTSVKGRSIIAYKFGSGSNTVLFNGNLHGNEINTKRLLDSWINELEGNPGRIPAGKTIVVIPLSNPDGYAAGTRTNANNVDLNRNFAANNWKSTVKMPTGETLATGGGLSAHSEPESQALVNYVNNLTPKLVMSYHNKGAVVVANDSGNSWNLTKTYSSKSGYRAENGSTIGSFFDYDTTGAFEDWLHDKKGIASVLIELATREGDEFGRNKNAMWQMVSDF